MSRTQAELAARRQELIAQSAAYREEIAGAFAIWHGPLSRVDRAFQVVTEVRRSAPWLGLILGAATFLLPSGIAAWIGRAQNAWRSVGSVFSIVSGPRR